MHLSTSHLSMSKEEDIDRELVFTALALLKDSLVAKEEERLNRLGVKGKQRQRDSTSDEEERYEEIKRIEHLLQSTVSLGPSVTTKSAERDTEWNENHYVYQDSQDNLQAVMLNIVDDGQCEDDEPFINPFTGQWIYPGGTFDGPSNSKPTEQ